MDSMREIGKPGNGKGGGICCIPQSLVLNSHSSSRAWPTNPFPLAFHRQRVEEMYLFVVARCKPLITIAKLMVKNTQCAWAAVIATATTTRRLGSMCIVRAASLMNPCVLGAMQKQRRKERVEDSLTSSYLRPCLSAMPYFTHPLTHYLNVLAANEKKDEVACECCT